jgi:hypothetical protein
LPVASELAICILFKPPGNGGKANSLLLTRASCESSLIYGNYKSIESSHFKSSVHFGLQRWEVGNYFKDPPDFELMASQVAKRLILNVVRVNSAPQLGHVNFFAAPDFSRTWRSRLLNGESSSNSLCKQSPDPLMPPDDHLLSDCGISQPGLPNGAKTQLLMHTNTNYLLDLCILLRLFDKEYQLIG